MGFEQRLWLPAGESSKFVVFDLGGHPLNRHLHQRLLAKRAIYVLTWRARSARNIGKLDTSVVLDFLNDLRLIVPGAAVVLVVTHCDCVMRSELEAQCLSVQTAVEGFLGSFVGGLWIDLEVAIKPAASAACDGLGFAADRPNSSSACRRRGVGR